MKQYPTTQQLRANGDLVTTETTIERTPREIAAAFNERVQGHTDTDGSVRDHIDPAHHL